MVNAHPHNDCNKELAVAHNGIIENYVELRDVLKERGHRFISETDTEVIPHLIEEGLETTNNLEDAIKLSVTHLEGSFAIAALTTMDPEVLVCARHGNPLILGIREDQSFCASDVPAFLPWTNRILWLRDGEMATLTVEGVKIQEYETGVEIQRKPQQVSWTAEMSQKGGYPHFMLKEIHEQPRAIRDTIKACKTEADKIVQVLNEAGQIYIVAAGTSNNAGRVAQYQIAELGKRSAQTIISSEFKALAANTVDEETVVIGITQSGETADTLQALRECHNKGAKIISITNVLGSSVTRLSEGVIYTRAGPEIGVAATKTYTTQLAVLSGITIRLGEYTGELSRKEASEYWDQLDCK
jgi:glucosamine--fructose-6-phosphate aminotransferase (isomerizing)